VSVKLDFNNKTAIQFGDPNCQISRKSDIVAYDNVEFISGLDLIPSGLYQGV